MEGFQKKATPLMRWEKIILEFEGMNLVRWKEKVGEGPGVDKEDMLRGEDIKEQV